MCHLYSKYISEKRDFVFEVISDQAIELLDNDILSNTDTWQGTYYLCCLFGLCVDVKLILYIYIHYVCCTDSSISTEDTSATLCGEETDVKPQQAYSVKRKRNTIDCRLPNTENTLRIERIQHVIKQDQQLAAIKQEHEERLYNLKENHLKEINNLELQHLKKIQSLEVEIKKSQLKAIDIEKENIDTSNGLNH